VYRELARHSPRILSGDIPVELAGARQALIASLPAHTDSAREVLSEITKGIQPLRLEELQDLYVRVLHRAFDSPEAAGIRSELENGVRCAPDTETLDAIRDVLLPVITDANPATSPQSREWARSLLEIIKGST
jgi:hypothetical protein